MGEERRSQTNQSRAARVAHLAIMRHMSAPALVAMTDDEWKDFCLDAGVLFDPTVCAAAVDLVENEWKERHE